MNFHLTTDMSTVPLKITRKQLFLSLATLAAASIAATSTPARAGSTKKDKYSAQQKKDIITESSQCPCGGSYQKCHKMKHFRTALHKSYESSLTLA